MIKVNRGYNMGINRLSLSARSQIIDVTELCSFEWYQKPASCKAYLEVSNATGNFTEGETIQGQSSGATATVFSSYVAGGRVYIENPNGTFQVGETIQGQSSGQTAVIDRFVEERSYPNNVIKGTFPDSLKSRDLNDWFEVESSGSGSGFIAHVRITLPGEGWYTVSPICGYGIDVNGISLSSRYFYLCARDRGAMRVAKPSDPGSFDRLASTRDNASLSFLYMLSQDNPLRHPEESVFLGLYQGDKGTFRWRIHSVRIFRFVF